MAITETQWKPMTGDELLRMGDIGQCELINGETIAIYHPDGTRARLTKSDTLTGNDVLPDFSVRVSEIFDL